MDNLIGLIIFIGLLVFGLLIRSTKSYIEEKFKNLATVEDSKKLREVLQSNTQTIEGVKNSLAHDFWISQRTWEFKRDQYLKMLENFGELRTITSYLTGIEKLRPDDNFLVRSAEYIKQQRQLQARLLLDLNKLTYTAPLLCGDELTQSFHRLNQAVRDFVGSSEGQAGLLKIIDTAYDEILRTAKKDLGLINDNL